jgi:hypothetical protein
MGTIFLIFSLLFTLGISWLNAHAAGAENAQSKLEGGFSRLLFGPPRQCPQLVFHLYSCSPH